jgi:hypothetical protein
MKYLFWIILFPLPLFSQQEISKHSFLNFDLKINHLVREQFFSVSVLYPAYKGLFVEAEYGYISYHHAGLALGYRFTKQNYRPYLTSGFFYNRDHFSKNGTYKEYCAKLGGGLETNLSKHFFANIEASLLKYSSVNYTLRKIKFSEEYDLNEAFDYSIVVGIGYRFLF